MDHQTLKPTFNEGCRSLKDKRVKLLSFFTAVKSIKKQHLVEVRSMGNPPPAVKLALESICLLLGEQATDWRTIRGVIIKDNFISTIVNFSTEDISYVASSSLKQSAVEPR